MMIFKGFAVHSGYIDNTPNTTAAFGEVSVNSLTYTKEKGVYVDRTISTAMSVLSFDSSVDGVPQQLPVTEAIKVLTVCNEVYDYGAANAGRKLTEEDYRVNLVTKHSSIIDEVDIGPVEAGDDVWLPTYIGFKIRNLTGKSATNRVTIWFNDQSFQIRYPDTEIVIVPPIEHLDDFFKPGVQVEAFLKELTMSEMVAKMQALRDKNPMTFIRTDSFSYHDPANATRVIPVDWGTLIYGVAGNNIDSIKEALEDFILSNSKHTRDEWAVIFPEIFRKNEVAIIPVWNAIAIPAALASDGMYSQQISLKKGLKYLTDSVPFLPKAHVETNGHVSGFPFKSIAIMSVGHFENTDGKFSLPQLFPDWINTNTNQDFNRMEPNTREWHLKLAYAIGEAEKFDETMVVPVDLMKVKRGDQLFLTFSHKKMNYLVLCKASKLAKL